MIRFYERSEAYRGFVRTLRANVRNYFDPDKLFRDVRTTIYNEINNGFLLRLRLIICLCITFQKSKENETVESKSFYFCSNAERILSSVMIYSKIDKAFRKILESIDSFVRNGSGWTIKKIEFIDLHLGNYRELRGGCTHAVQLPIRLKNKKSLLNICCHDNKCFLYCVAAKLFPVKNNKYRASKYKKYIKYFDTRDISFPVKLSEVYKFERKNNLKINVFGFESNDVFPIYVSKNIKSRRPDIDLLYYERHFFLITNFSKFLNFKPGLYHFCRNCLNGFQRKRTLESHKQICEKQNPQKLSLPSNLTLKFNALNKMLYHPFAAYADFECVCSKISTALPNTTESFSCAFEKHIAVSYTLIVLDINDNIVFHEFYVGDDAVTNFLNTLKNVYNKVMKKMKMIIPMDTNLSVQYNENVCHICGKEFIPGEIKTKDHCHYTGHIRGLAHQSCNINMRSTYFLPVIIHNSKNYDNHLILKHIPENYVKNIYIIPVNLEKFTMFTLDSIKFLDSYQFLDASLECLVQNLIKSGHKFNIFNSFYQNEKNRQMLLRKGLFPYSYFQSLDVLEEEGLPPKSAFYNRLTESDISDEDYEHACAVYKAFNCNKFSDYLELYQNCDVILLAEAFTSFRRTAMTYYSLDPVHFVTSADLTWNAGLKLSKVELQLFSDINDYVWVESQMRGGICFLGKRYVTANDPYIPETYNPNKDNSYLIALDANNLYGFVMVQPLPYGNFRWLTESEIKKFNILETTPNSSVGYLIEVDLDYPEELHILHDDLPMAPEHLKITYEMLSPHAKKLCDSLNLKHVLPCKKLTPNFFKKKNYICHYLNLKYYVENGLEIKKIHKILSFSQKAWLKDYINFNNEKRRDATNDFEKSFFKKMNNSFYGKTCMNLRKRQNVKATTNAEQCKKYLSSPSLEYFEIVNDFLTLFKCRKTNLIVDKPIYVGFTVLELSKLKMYSLYYDYFKSFYKENCSLVYIDTDSLFLSIKCKNVYYDLKKHFHDIIDFSNYDSNHEMHDLKNKGKLGKLKNEYCLPIKEFIGLKCKLYSVSYGDNIKMKAKGVKKSSLKKLTIDSYKDVLKNDSFTRQTQNSIISKNHEIFSIIQNKIALSSFYDKKFLLDDSINCRSYGHLLNDKEPDS